MHPGKDSCCNTSITVIKNLKPAFLSYASNSDVFAAAQAILWFSVLMTAEYLRPLCQRSMLSPRKLLALVRKTFGSCPTRPYNTPSSAVKISRNCGKAGMNTMPPTHIHGIDLTTPIAQANPVPLLNGSRMPLTADQS